MTGAVLITGASSGLGLELAVHLAERGYRSFAGIRDLGRRADLEQEAARRKVSVEILQLDVRDPVLIQRAVDTVLERCGSIFALVNNAGIQYRGYFEDLEDLEIHAVLATNLLGTMNMTRAVLPSLRAAGRGRIVMISSIAGRMGMQGLSSYCASKFALEGFGESLALEVAPLGIQVSLIEPGLVATPIWGVNRHVARRAVAPASAYATLFAESERLADWALRSSRITSADVAHVVERCLRSPRPALRYRVGRRAGLVLTLRRILPEAVFDRFYIALLTRHLLRPSKADAD